MVQNKLALGPVLRACHALIWNSWQSIIWTSDEPVHWRINELNVTHRLPAYHIAPTHLQIAGYEIWCLETKGCCLSAKLAKIGLESLSVCMVWHYLGLYSSNSKKITPTYKNCFGIKSTCSTIFLLRLLRSPFTPHVKYLLRYVLCPRVYL